MLIEKKTQTNEKSLFVSGKHDEEISLLRHCIELINSRDQDFLKKAISILISSNSEVEIATALTGIRFYSDLKKETNFAIPKPT